MGIPLLVDSSLDSLKRERGGGGRHR